MHLDDIRPDDVLHFEHMHGNSESKPVVVLEVMWAEQEVRILDAYGNTGIAFPKELSPYNDEEHKSLVESTVILNLYTQRVNFLGKNLFRLWR